MRARCLTRDARAGSTSACGTGSSPRPAATRSRCWSCRGVDGGGAGRRVRAARRPAARDTHRAELPPPARAASRRDADGCCWWRRPSRSATSTCCGARPISSGSAPTRPRRRETAGLIEFGARVRFRHPLVRSAAYRAATRADRQEAHRALAAATDPDSDPDRRAWHRAHAAVGPDEELAAELERSAERAQGTRRRRRRGRVPERATELTPDPARRAARALAAAQAKFEPAAPEAALELLATAEPAPLDELAARAAARGCARRSRSPARAARDAARLLLEAARRLEPLRPAAGPRDLPRSAPSGHLRRSPRRRQPACRPWPTPPAPRRRRDDRHARSTCSSMAWHPVHRGLRRRRGTAAASARRVLAGGRAHRGRHALALAGVPRRARADRPRPVGRRDVAPAHRRAVDAGARRRRAHGPADRAHGRAGVHVHAGEFAAAAR